MPKVQAAALGREYETIYVRRPDITSEGAKKLAGRVQEIVTSKDSGKLTLFESWGRRQMAYATKRHRHGVYVYLKYVGDGGVVSELERNLRLLDDVIKFQTVKLSDDVDRQSVTVDPNQVSLDNLELAPYEYEEESKERMLGLAESKPPPSPSGIDDDSMDDQGRDRPGRQAQASVEESDE